MRRLPDGALLGVLAMSYDHEIEWNGSIICDEGPVSASTNRKNEPVLHHPQGQAIANPKSIIRRPMQALSVISCTEAHGKWLDRFDAARPLQSYMKTTLFRS